MFSHIALGTNDQARSKKFYDAIMNVIGGRYIPNDPKGRLIYLHKDGKLIVTSPVNGEPANGGNGVTIGFKMASTEMANAWHKAGLEAGGTAIEDPPGWRKRPSGDLYLAYLRDPDGNKLCALYTE